MWYAVMRRQERGVYIGALVLRHGDHHTLLLERGWEEVPVEEIGGGLGAAPQPPAERLGDVARADGTWS